VIDSKLQGQTVRHLVEAGGVELKIDQLYDPRALRLTPGEPVTVAVSRDQVHEVAG
jgi:hypothetical protein